MATGRAVLVKCRFTRGGFAHERVFWIPAPDRSGEYRGLSYISYCYRLDHTPLPTEEPPPGKSIPGFVVARVIKDSGGNLLTVQVPDGELCDVDQSIVEEQRNVPVGS